VSNREETGGHDRAVHDVIYSATLWRVPRDKVRLLIAARTYV
jgi:hypothetical protein